MRQLIGFSALALLSFTLMNTSALSADEGFERWEKRIPGHPVAFSNEPTTDLHLHCPEFVGPLEERGVRGGFTPGCEARLDEQYLDEIPPLMPFEAADNRVSWRYVFDQPHVKRSLVLDALSNPECLSALNDVAPDALAERCRADAIADYAVLKYQCGGDYYGIRSRIANGTESPWWYTYRLERLIDNESYWRKRWGVERAYFRYAWITAKCAGLPDGVLASLGVFDDSKEFGGDPAPDEENWWWAEQGFEAYQLMGIADQLSTELTRTAYGYDPISITTWQRVEPVMAEVLQVKDPGEYVDASQEKAARLKHFVAASTWMKIRRSDKVSEDWLLEQVGEFSNEELEQAASEATTMMAKQETDSYLY
ncbi:MAG: hypothetical protein OXG05_11710 [Gammaproteobacteria bacterium]|nr:hypothetical protein [Gammaproteobacteria bacterium]